MHVLTFLHHANSQALLEAAGWASLPLGRVHGAALSLRTCVALVVLHRALEEALMEQKDKVGLMREYVLCQCRISKWCASIKFKFVLGFPPSLQGNINIYSQSICVY